VQGMLGRENTAKTVQEDLQGNRTYCLYGMLTLTKQKRIASAGSNPDVFERTRKAETSSRQEES
jgi:hypothetical protein